MTWRRVADRLGWLRPPPRSFWLWWILGVPAALLGGDAPPMPPAGPPRRLPDEMLAVSPTDDIRLALRARQALLRDPDLAPLNLSVTIRQGQATVWGPIPDETYQQRVRRRLLDVPGIFAVKSKLYQGQPPSREELTTPLEPEAPALTQSALPDRHKGTLGQLTGLPEKVAPSPGVSLLAPIAAPALGDPTPSASKEPAARSADVGSRVDALRRSDPRFQPLRFSCEGSIVTLKGSPSQGTELMIFAREVRRLPGVSKVVVRTSTLP